jgi:hypothetical protein
MKKMRRRKRICHNTIQRGGGDDDLLNTNFLLEPNY